MHLLPLGGAHRPFQELHPVTVQKMKEQKSILLIYTRQLEA